MNAFTALKLPDDKEPHTGLVVFAQSGPDWTETEVRLRKTLAEQRKIGTHNRELRCANPVARWDREL
jgi:hypothetical protein